MRGRDSVFDEPHFDPEGFEPDPSAVKDQPTLAQETAYDSVFEEPTMAGQDSPYAAWLLEGRERAAWASRFVFLGAALAAGPLAIVSALWGAGQTWISVLALTVFGPLVEEMGKIMVPLILVERRPFLFRSRAQILLVGLVGGLAFAALENLVYFHVYLADPSPELIRWRWTVCVALHAGCSLLASIGVARIWAETWRSLKPPATELGVPFWIAATVLHGLYNALALLLETLKTPF